METVIFNADFEWQLFQTKQSFKSSRKTQEFEYLINWIDPDFTIFTTKHYPKEYQRWYFKFLQQAFKYTNKSSKVIPWSGNYSQIQLKRKLQDKSRTLTFAAKYELGPKEFSLLNSVSDLEPEYLYKFPKSLSGMGHYEYNDIKKISRLLDSGEVLTKEKKLQRTLDFSTLWSGDQIICYYQNLINDSYQYRGSIIDEKLEFLSDEQFVKFEEKLPLIRGWFDGLEGFFSIDSFIYKDGTDEYIYYLSEINCRKTMGYVAHRLKLAFFPKSRIMKFLFGKYNIPVEEYENLFLKTDKKVIALSPDQGKFKAFIIGAESAQEIRELEKLLF